MCKHLYRIDGQSGGVLNFKCQHCGQRQIVNKTGYKFYLTHSHSAESYYKLFILIS